MKTKLLLFTVSVMLLSTIYSCDCDKCEEELEVAKKEIVERERLCESCKFYERRTTTLPKKYEVSLKLNCQDTINYQVFQYDILNSYVILGKITLSNDTIKNISFEILDICKKNRFYIKDIQYSEIIPSDKGVKYSHNFKFTINNTKDGIFVGDPNLDEDFKIEFGQNIRVQIDSENDSRIINTEEFYTKFINNNSLQEKNDFIFPPFICPVKITEGN